MMTIPRPIKFIRHFCKALLDPSWSPYDEMVLKLNEEYGITPGAKAPWLVLKEQEAEGWDPPEARDRVEAEAPGTPKAPGMNRRSRNTIGVGLPLMGYGPGGYSDTDDESYYGL